MCAVPTEIDANEILDSRSYRLKTIKRLDELAQGVVFGRWRSQS